MSAHAEVLAAYNRFGWPKPTRSRAIKWLKAGWWRLLTFMSALSRDPLKQRHRRMMANHWQKVA